MIGARFAATNKEVAPMPHTSTLDAESLRLVLDSLADFAKANLSDEKLLELD
jgi:hypothetical protein